MPDKKYCEVHLTLNSWEDAFGLAMEFAANTGTPRAKNWVFRGQSGDWALDSGLRRGRRNAGNKSGYLDCERRVITHFRDNAHLMDPHLPAQLSNLEWAARMQHYGGPSRLLDVTRSFWVAAFFALEVGSAGKVKKPLIWAVDGTTLYGKVKTHLTGKELWTDVEKELCKNGKKFRGGLYSEKMRASRQLSASCIWGEAWQKKPKQHKLALYVESGWTDKRIVAQSAAFICPLSVDFTVADCLVSAFSLPIEDKNKIVYVNDYDPIRTPETRVFQRDHGERRPVLLKIFLPSGDGKRKEGLNILEKMNITSATLFPGMDGLARSLYTHLTR